ncbi:hypothetical protein JKF63_05081 [Porcisia hertigi]|uniref:Uncharacterized protein n=1 Tax=Porcisia hertigi TaxID=2761500 RepID=A0A836LEW9_9TRYP|nr:hypothetical protein JKF63_05081 [Porcisia hertigi]
MPCSQEYPLGTLFGVLEERFPRYRQQLVQAQKMTRQASSVLDKATPYLAKANLYCTVAKEQAVRFKLDEFCPMLLGLALCFFGGAYTMLIAVVETVRLLCWADLRHSFEVLYHNYELAVEQSRKDNGVGYFAAGVAGGTERGQGELLSSKAALFLKSVDVEAVQTASRTIIAAAMSVIAALRVRFARSFALGVSLASMAIEYVPLEAALKEVLPTEYKKWAGIITSIATSTITMALATILSGTIGMVHCCIRGAHMFLQHAVHLAKAHGLLEDDITLNNLKSNVLVAVIALMGFLWQVSHTKANPFPINILLLPFTVAEYVLFFLVNGFLYAAP